MSKKLEIVKMVHIMNSMKNIKCKGYYIGLHMLSIYLQSK